REKRREKLGVEAHAVAKGKDDGGPGVAVQREVFNEMIDRIENASLRDEHALSLSRRAGGVKDQRGALRGIGRGRVLTPCFAHRSRRGVQKYRRDKKRNIGKILRGRKQPAELETGVRSAEDGGLAGVQNDRHSSQGQRRQNSRR